MTEREIFIGSVGPHLYEDTDDLYDPLDTDDSGVFDGISGTPGILTNGSVVAGSLALFDTNASNILSLIWNEDDTVDRVLNLLVGGASRSVTLNEDFIVGDGYNVTITALGQANTLTLNEGFTIGDGYPGTLTFSSACVLTVEATSLINQDLTTDSIVATFGRLLINSAASPPSQLKIQGNSLGVISALVYGADNAAIGFDADYNAAWYARDTEAALIYKTGGYLKIYGDDSLTPGNTFTPNALIDIGLATGDFDIKLHDAATVGLKLGGTLVTVSAVEINYLEGVSSAIQTQLNAKQTSDATLTSIAALGTAADKMLYTTDVDTWAETAITAAGRAIIDDANAAAQCTTLGLGTGDSPVFVTAKLSGLTDGYVPYHVADATGLANSPIFTDGTSVGIGTTGPNIKLHVAGPDNSVVFSVGSPLNSLNKYVGMYIGDSVSARKGGIFFELTDTYNRGSIHIVTDNTADWGDVIILDKGITLTQNGNVGIGTTAFPATLVKGLVLGAGTAPTADVADQISIHVEDIAAGHAALHIRNENSTIVKLYQQAHITDAPGDTAANNATTINAILTALENNGLLASA